MLYEQDMNLKAYCIESEADLGSGTLVITEKIE